MWKAVEFDKAAKQRIAEAAKQELRLRLEGLLAIKTQVGPFLLYPLTMQGVVEMQYAENAYICEGSVGMDDRLQFLWVTSDRAEIKSQKRFFNQCGKLLRDADTVAELDAYFAAQFNDMPTGSGEGSKEQSSQPFIVPVMDTLAHEYGWSTDHIMSLPVSVAFQMFQQVMYRLSGYKRHPSNPITQHAKAKELQRLNKKAS